VREVLWNEVLHVVTDIVWGPDHDDAQATSVKVARLRAVYARQESLGQPDPFLTEAFADYTEDAAEAVDLYRLALAQSGVDSQEPTHTKRICMAERLIQLGDIASASAELMLGRAEAVRLQDHDYVVLADDLLSSVSEHANDTVF
jgi:hypothetical protein